MELLLLLVLMPALLFAGNTTTTTNATGTVGYNVSTESSMYGIRSTNTPKVIRLPPILTRVKVIWEESNPCQGMMYLNVNFTNKPQALCYETIKNFEELGIDICEERRCGSFLDFKLVPKMRGYIITNEDLTEITCSNVHINCKGSKELVAFKAIAGVLLVLVLAVILLHFGRPMYTAIRKRFSQKRENRWIGPTQSQSVSYHRGQAAHSDNNMVKRQSYPGLERLTVNPSREPSSNRNSDYDSYGYH
ncbi:CD5 molecule [Brachyhypopomus gauderio]|uniref:CD5 molecule n=1 Tax=Brachyhypopomus gauderio TaxID=698409 RepID=UPI004042EC17